MPHIVVIGDADAIVKRTGQQLSDAIDRPLYILDQLIERGETVSIATIIQDEGLDAYHEIESVYLESVLKRDPGVIILNAQVARSPRNAALLESHCVIWVTNPNC